LTLPSWGLVAGGWRGVRRAAMSTGIARRCIEVMNRYSRERKAFGTQISSFGQIQSHIATSYAEWAAARAYTYHTANELDLNATGSNRLDSDGVKLVASVMATTVVRGRCATGPTPPPTPCACREEVEGRRHPYHRRTHNIMMRTEDEMNRNEGECQSLLRS
jgi:hypothetical protein